MTGGLVFYHCKLIFQMRQWAICSNYIRDFIHSAHPAAHRADCRAFLRPYRGQYHAAASASPQATSMTECCLVNTVDTQISPAHTKASTFSQGRPWASSLLAKARAMQPELWQWMEGQTLLEASAFQISCMMSMAKLSRPTCSAVGRRSTPLGRIMYKIRQKVIPENIIRQSLS